MSEKGRFKYDDVALGRQRFLVGLEIDAPTHEAFLSLVRKDDHVADRLVKLARAGLPEDFRMAVTWALLGDERGDLPAPAEVDFARLARLLVLAWGDDPSESVPVKARSRRPGPEGILREWAIPPRESPFTSHTREALRRLMGSPDDEGA